MCWVIGFGPLDENEATKGAGTFTSSDLCITADGVLHLGKTLLLNKKNQMFDKF